MPMPMLMELSSQISMAFCGALATSQIRSPCRTLIYMHGRSQQSETFLSEALVCFRQLQCHSSPQHTAACGC